MFDYLGMAYKDPDCTVVIAVMQPRNFSAETHLGGGNTSAFVGRHCSITLFDFVASIDMTKGLQRF